MQKCRIWVLLRGDEFDVRFLAKNSQMMHFRVMIKSTLQQFMLTVAYASNQLSDRLFLWDDLRKLQHRMPWIVAGDFNNVLRVEEREGGNVPSVQEMQPFANCFTDCGLTDMRSRGRKFTWTNNDIRSKIDRILVNEAWLDDFPAAETWYQAEELSDDTKSVVTH